MYDELIKELEENKEAFDLAGVEITEEDASYAWDFILEGYSREEAIQKVLQGIRDCVSEGWEF